MKVYTNFDDKLETPDPFQDYLLPLPDFDICSLSADELSTGRNNIFYTPFETSNCKKSEKIDVFFNKLCHPILIQKNPEGEKREAFRFCHLKSNIIETPEKKACSNNKFCQRKDFQKFFSKNIGKEHFSNKGKNDQNKMTFKPVFSFYPEKQAVLKNKTKFFEPTIFPLKNKNSQKNILEKKNIGKENHGSVKMIHSFRKPVEKITGVVNSIHLSSLQKNKRNVKTLIENEIGHFFESNLKKDVFFPSKIKNDKNSKNLIKATSENLIGSIYDCNSTNWRSNIKKLLSNNENIRKTYSSIDSNKNQQNSEIMKNGENNRNLLAFKHFSIKKTPTKISYHLSKKKEEVLKKDFLSPRFSTSVFLFSKK